MFKRFWHIAAISVFAALQCAQAQAQICAPGAAPCVYSVKFICGNQSVNPSPPSEPAVKPGNYATSINVHYFHETPSMITIIETAVVANPETQSLGPMSLKPIPIFLTPGQAFEIDCNDIVNNLFKGVSLQPFVEGFVELRGSFPILNVTAVDTAQPATAPPAPSGPVSIEVVPVQPFVGP